MNSIPIKTILYDSTIFPGYFLAKSGIKFQNFLKKSQLVSGFGFGEHKRDVFNSARFEVLEHLYATYEFQKESLQNEV